MNMRYTGGGDAQNSIRLLSQMMADAQALLRQPEIDQAQIDEWDTEATGHLRQVFGLGSPSVDRVVKEAEGDGFKIKMSESERQEFLRSTISNKIRKVQGYIDQLRSDIAAPVPTARVSSPEPAGGPRGKNVFIVHGHDGEIKQTVARFVEKLKLKAIILHECDRGGSRAIINAFQEESDSADFAIILMTPDDEGKACKAPNLRHRARQNVVFEFGFFFGRLGPERVVALVKGDVEKPSDLDGVLYISVDNADWQMRLAKNLHKANLDADWSKLLA
jgi:predicted nucleotide-binding protein